MEVKNNLNEIIYEAVNEDYGWGRYGDFKVLIRRKDGYINATKLCQDGCRDLATWMRSKTADAIIEELESLLQICRSGIINMITGGSESKNKIISGTYVHQDLVPHIASWISPKFAIKVSKIVNNFIVREYNEQIREKNDRIDQLIQKTDHLIRQNDELKDELKAANVKLTRMDRRLEVANENIIETLDNLGAVSNERVPISRMDNQEHEQLILLHLDGDRYKVIRAQRRAVNKAVRAQQIEYPNLSTIVTLNSRPNARELWNAIKKCLRERNVSVQSTNIFLRDGMNQDELIQVFRECNGEKFDLFAKTRSKIQKVMVEPPHERELWNKTCAELKQICKNLGIKRFSSLKKVDLIASICST